MKVFFMLKHLQLIIISLIIWIFSWILLEKIGEQTGLGINRTSSQACGIYAYFPIRYTLKKGDLVDCDLNFSNPSLRWIKLRQYIKGNKKLLKNIGALPGDWLFTVYPNIYVCNKNKLTNDCRILGACIKKDKSGLPVFCQNWNGIQVPNNYFYLQSNHVLNSFDSRYFGLVHRKNIFHRVKILVDFS